MMQPALTRGAGLLLAVSSLPSAGGIGSLGAAARAFVDQLKAAGQRYWQVLPLSPTGFGDSPYQSCSAFAGNPYFIDVEQLVEEGLLTAGEAEGERAEYPDPGRVDYARLFRHRLPLLRRAFVRKNTEADATYQWFCREQAAWLDDYALFMTVKQIEQQRPWTEWHAPLRDRDPEALAAVRQDQRAEIEFWKLCQYYFFTQWRRLHRYAEERGIQIIGDMPLYVSADSADVWANRALFRLDRDGKPSCVAGVPPDAFSATGQWWGNPLYDWEAMERAGFDWWCRRMKSAAALYDVIRIDHFIGIVRYWSIPADEPTAVNGAWRDGPGSRLLDAILPAAAPAKILAEDLGVFYQPVTDLLRDYGLPGMRVLLFAFGSGAGNTHLPHHYPHNAVVYTGTHDNQTVCGALESASPDAVRHMKDYTGVEDVSALPWALIRTALASTADVAILPVQDVLGLGDEARMNTPSTLGDNWQWRLPDGQPDGQRLARLRALTEVYGRLNC